MSVPAKIDGNPRRNTCEGALAFIDDVDGIFCKLTASMPIYVLINNGVKL